MSIAPTSIHPEPTRSGLPQRLYIVFEVLTVFTATHLLIKSFKLFSRLGILEREARLNFSPGLCMAGVAVLILLARRRPFSHFGFQSPRLLRDRRWLSPRAIIPAAFLYLCPLVLFFHFDPNTGHAFLNYFGFLSTVSLGEEFFFRGYMQSRLNEIFGKPLAVRGIRFGVGLVISNTVFGFMHGLNTVDYFHGYYTFHWWWAIGSLIPGFFYGLIRETTDSVWPGGIAHGLWDVWSISLWALLRQLSG